MSDLVTRAREFAGAAHERIGHRRKYTQQPYAVHLREVARLVAEVTDDPQAIAAAWLHDTVEDTLVTFEDLELEFGAAVAQLVAEVTDVSQLSDGNRAARKARDRAHLAAASARGQTIKLADLIDNCRDICEHDPSFARVYADEKEALLAVLTRGDPQLQVWARQTLVACRERLAAAAATVDPSTAAAAATPPGLPGLPLAPLQRLFLQAFAARDLAEPLRSFDAERDADAVRESLAARGLLVAGVRRQGEVRGYVLPYDLVGGTCGEAMRSFRVGQVVTGDASLASVIAGLTRHDHVFVADLGGPAGVITRADIQKPMVRMWLFGIITLIEMEITRHLRERFPGAAWSAELSAARLRKAQELQAERARRDQPCDLLDCLQFADKAEILLTLDQARVAWGFRSRNEGKRVVQALQSLRNNLAHAQDIVGHDWPQIARMARNLEARLLREAADE